jgi:hypothetical protein
MGGGSKEYQGEITQSRKCSTWYYGRRRKPVYRAVQSASNQFQREKRHSHELIGYLAGRLLRYL